MALYTTLAALVFPAAANGRMTNDVQRLTTLTPVALAVYQPSCGTPVVTVGQPTLGDVDGEAYMDGSCRITIRPGLDDARFCQVLVHEFGHLAGHEHEPTGIMNTTAEADVPGCDMAVANSLDDYDRAVNIFRGEEVALIKAIRHATPAYARGVRWVVYTDLGDRYLVSGAGNSMSAEWTDSRPIPKAAGAPRSAAVA
jgi:hypothetical protein